MSRIRLMKIGPTRTFFNCRRGGKKTKSKTSSSVKKKKRLRESQAITSQRLNPVKMPHIPKEDFLKYNHGRIANPDLYYELAKYHERLVLSGQRVTLPNIKSKCVEFRECLGINDLRFIDHKWVHYFLKCCEILRENILKKNPKSALHINGNLFNCYVDVRDVEKVVPKSSRGNTENSKAAQAPNDVSIFNLFSTPPPSEDETAVSQGNEKVVTPDLSTLFLSPSSSEDDCHLIKRSSTRKSKPQKISNEVESLNLATNARLPESSDEENDESPNDGATGLLGLFSKPCTSSSVDTSSNIDDDDESDDDSVIVISDDKSEDEQLEVNIERCKPMEGSITTNSMKKRKVGCSQPEKSAAKSKRKLNWRNWKRPPTESSDVCLYYRNPRDEQKTMPISIGVPMFLKFKKDNPRQSADKKKCDKPGPLVPFEKRKRRPPLYYVQQKFEFPELLPTVPLEPSAKRKCVEITSIPDQSYNEEILTDLFESVQDLPI